MSESYFLRPAPGRRVRDPITLSPLKEDGEEKPQSSYWDRRLFDGDVIEGPAPKAEPKKTRSAESKE